MARVIGIDLGTTFSAAAYVDETGRPKIVPNPEGKTTTPSVVLIRDGKATVGEVAMNQWVTDEEHVVRWIKSAMGDPDYRFQGKSPVEISAEILKTLKADAELVLGEEIREAVITCPAYFASVEIENTKRAGELAGFHVREIVKEPTAAAVYYGVDNMREGETVMVCDLGGGTYDATILRLAGGVFSPLCSSGDRRLGGHNWTMDLVDLAAGRFQEKFGEDPRNNLAVGQVLYEACEQAKRDLARSPQASIACQLDGRLERIVVTRQDFETRTEWLMSQVVARTEEALQKAQPAMTWRDIDRVLLVGGSSRLRRMAEALEQASSKKSTQTGEADLMVALGAAILAYGKVRPRKKTGALMEAPGGLVEVERTRIITRSLGTRTLVFEKNKPRIVNALLIPHSTGAPVTKSREDFEVSANGQQTIETPVVEFEADDSYELVGNYRFSCLPGSRRGDKVRLTFHYDESSICTVTAFDVKSGKELSRERLPRYSDPDLEQVMRVRVRPRWVVFAVDTSGSMSGVKIAAAKQALVSNARGLLALGGDACKVGIVSFAGSASIVCNPTSDIAAIEKAAATMAAYGTTAMDEGILLAIKVASGAPEGADRDVVMLTDGMPDEGRRQTTLKAAGEAKSRSVTLSSLGVGRDQVDQAYLSQLSPMSLVIDKADGIADAMTTLLTQSAVARGGGLMEG
jgi:molecular chaperone DnaK